MLKDGLRFPVAINPVRFPATSYQPLLSLVPHGPILGILSRILPLSHAGAEEGPFLWLFCHPTSFSCLLLTYKAPGSSELWPQYEWQHLGPEFKDFLAPSCSARHTHCLFGPCILSSFHFIFSVCNPAVYLMRYQEGTSAGQRALRGSDAVDIFGEG